MGLTREEGERFDRNWKRMMMLLFSFYGVIILTLVTVLLVKVNSHI